MTHFCIVDKNKDVDLHELMMENILDDYKSDVIPQKETETKKTEIKTMDYQVVPPKLFQSVTPQYSIRLPKITKIIEYYAVLDSYVKLKESDIVNGEFKWGFNTHGQTLSEQVGISESLVNVTSIQIGTFYIPIIEDSTYMDRSIEAYGTIELYQYNTSNLGEPPTMIRQDNNYGQYTYSTLFDNETYKFPWPNNPYSQIPFANKISIQIKETGLQSYANFNNVRYNFEFIAHHNNRLNGNPNFIQVKPVNGNKWDEYNFNTPIHDLNTISMVFRNPDYPISFEPDIFYDATIDITFDCLYRYIIVTNTNYPHKLCAGDRIFFRNFIPMLSDNTPNTNFPSYLLNYIQRSNGHAVNAAPCDSAPLDPSRPLANQFRFGLDPGIKLVEPIDPNILASFPGKLDVFIAKRRIRIPIKIKTIQTVEE